MILALMQSYKLSTQACPQGNRGRVNYVALVILQTSALRLLSLEKTLRRFIRSCWLPTESSTSRGCITFGKGVARSDCFTTLCDIFV